MILHVDTQREGIAPGRWLAILTKIVGFQLDEHIVLIEDQPERILATITTVGHAARIIERNGHLKDNKIIIQDDREESSGHSEQFELFEMLVGRRKKLLSLGGDYAKFLKAVVDLIWYWKIRVGLATNFRCENCQMFLEGYKPQCIFCGVKHAHDWRKIDEYQKRLAQKKGATHKRDIFPTRGGGLTFE